MKQYFILYTNDKFERHVYNAKTGEYGSYDYHDAGNASTIKSAKSVIRQIRKEFAEYHPRNFRVYDRYGDIDPETQFVPCVYHED